MRNALKRVRLDKVGTTNVSSSSGIPKRTLRRYVKFSKDPESIFFIEEPEEESEDEDVIVWKPQTAVPMFKLWTKCSADASASINCSLVSDDVDIASTQDDSNGNAIVATVGACTPNDNVSAGTGANFGDFVDVDVSGDDGLSTPKLCAADVFDNSDFDELFQDFLGDDMFDDN